MTEPINPKKRAGEEAVKLVQDGMVLGLGTGSTAYWAIEAIGARMKEEGLRIQAMATSLQSDKQARALGIPIYDFDAIDHFDLTIDGADETDPGKNLIKGGGGALLREKIVATNSRVLVIVVDQSKLVERLGKFPLPVEVTIFGWQRTMASLAAKGANPILRHKDGKPYLTDNGNYILDCAYGQINDAAALQEELNGITGVVEHGLFIGLAKKVIAGYENGEIKSF